MFVCIEHGENTLHFIFELIARCPVAALAARRLGEKLPLAFSSQINLPQNQITTRRDSWERYKKEKYKAEGTLKQNAKSSETRERNERSLPTHYVFIRR